MTVTQVPRVAFVSLGCRVNRVETDRIVGELRASGCAVVGEREAQAIIINTCAVTGEAEAKTRKAVRHAASLAQRPLVVATGCVANLFADELTSIADNVIVETDKGQVARRVLDELQISGELLPAVESTMPTATGRTRPGVKVQDGCDLRCTYCIVWKARGRSRSVAPDEVVAQVLEACRQGAPEVVLTGINLGRYQARSGQGELLLPDLIELLLDKTDVGRLRLSSIEPQDVDERLADVVARSEGRVAPFLHMCLQSGCDATLRRMGRVYNTTLFAERLAMVRERLPHASFGTDLIVGFPGETEEEFAESLRFCEEARFSRMHIFRYSKRPGTKAAEMDGQVSPIISARRAAQMHDLAVAMRLAEARSLVGTRDRVVVQAPGAGVTGGLFDAVLDDAVPAGSLADVRVTGYRDDATLVCTCV